MMEIQFMCYICRTWKHSTGEHIDAQEREAQRAQDRNDRRRGPATQIETTYVRP